NTQRQLDTCTTAEDDSYLSSDLDLQNRKVTQSCRRLQLARRASRNEKSGQSDLDLPSKSLYRCRDSVVNRQEVDAKLFGEKADLDAASQSILNIASSISNGHLKRHKTPGEYFRGTHFSDGECFARRVNEQDWKQSSTPRIVRAIRQNNKKRNSKSSVVVLYHGEFNIPASSSSRALVLSKFSKSNPTVETSRVSQLEIISPTKSPKVVETPETLSPRYPLRRRKTCKKYRRILGQPSLNVNIYHANRVERLVSPPLHRWSPRKRQLKLNCNCESQEYVARLPEDSVKSPSRTIPYHIDKPAVSQRPHKCIEKDKLWEQQCSLVKATVLKSMDHRPKNVETEDTNDRRRSALYSNLSLPMHQVQTHVQETDSKSRFIVNKSVETNRTFPFQPTPSGNLKIVPNQVVFESNKFSVLVADPRHTKVNVKTELNRPSIDQAGTSTSESPNRATYIDLPPGVTSSMINQLQARKKLPYIEGSYRSRMQPSTKLYSSEMEQNQNLVQSTSHHFPPLNEVPLASLGFTNEQPIDWSNIILPEKTDLYQELARRITNYKNADCVVRIDRDEFHCHLLVLQSYSSFFDEKNCKDIDLSDSNVTSKAFSIIYDWMISPINESYQLLRRDNILEIFMAAQYLGIKELEEQCWAFIDNDELFSEDTAFLLYLEAKKIGNTAVMELMVPRIMKFFLMLVSTKDFLELSTDELCLLLKSNYICVNSEMEVLMSAVRWLMHDWNERKQYMLEVLKCVRFGLIAPWQLVDVKRNPENPEFMELMSYPEIQKMVDDGLAFVIIKYWYGNRTEDYYHWIDLLGLNEPTNRNWAGEDKNYVTYHEFLLYLEEYQKTNISEIKAGKIQTKPTPPNSPPKDSSLLSLDRTHANCNKNCCTDSHLLEQCVMQTREPKRYLSKNTASSGLAMPPEILNNCLSNIRRNNNIIPNKGPCDESGNSKSIVCDMKYCESGEPRKSLDFSKNTKCMYEHHQHEVSMVPNKPTNDGRGQEKNAYNFKHWKQNVIFPIKRQQKIIKKLRCTNDYSVSAKSEEEAATMIQATYKGYKVRRKFDEIKKSSLEGKQNAQKVAELLSMTTSQCRWSLQNSLSQVKAFNNIANRS
ncbi:uncharacterized protein, partial [Cardiocondyla obscurior]|uniref:uncharacterized protein n=1 Tax=Cardiocondyla obscurior TaxID=286306 RepID=UPI003965664E